jgi:hypothetical protein
MHLWLSVLCYVELLAASIFLLWYLKRIWPDIAADFLSGAWRKEVSNFIQVVFAAPVFFALWKVSQVIARWDYHHFGDTFNSDMFDPIRIPGPAAGTSHEDNKPLRWLPPNLEDVSDPRASQWKEFQEWIGNSLTEQPKPFEWALVVGRPGAGKSRTTDEFSRRVLARRELLGDHRETNPDSSLFERAKVAAGIHRLRLGAWWRRGIRCPAIGDPWDVGRPAHRRQGGAPLPFSHTYIDRLSAWRPRAPTLVILEDPCANEASKLIEILQQQMEHYVFPVRLLIVNQTIPADLSVDFNEGTWRSDQSYFSNKLWAFDERVYFSFSEFRILLSSRFPDGGDKRGWLYPRDEESFKRLTFGGNPLLVEALIDWLSSVSTQSRPDLNSISAQKLIQIRVNRVRVALVAAGVKDQSQWELMAAATLLNGIERTKLHRDQTSILNDLLMQNAFPSDNVRQLIPSIRPSLIGAAFIASIIRRPGSEGIRGDASEEQQQTTAANIVALAFRVSPYEVLAALHNLASPAWGLVSGLTDTQRFLLEAINHNVLDAHYLERLSLTANEFTVLLHECIRFELERGGIRVMIVGLLENIPVESARGVMNDLPTLVRRDGVSARDALSVTSLVLHRALADGAPEYALAVTTPLIELANQLAKRGRLLVPEGTVTSKGYARLGELLMKGALDPVVRDQREFTTALVNCELALWDCFVARQTVVADFCAAAATEHSTATGCLNLHLLQLATTVFAVYLDVGRAMTSIQEIDRSAAELATISLAERIELAECQVRAWSRMAFAYSALKDAANTERWAERVATLVHEFQSLPLSERHELAEWQAASYRYVNAVYSELKDAANAERWAKQIAQLVQEFYPLPSSERLYLGILQAYSYVGVVKAHAASKDVANAQRWTEHVTQLVQEFCPLALSERLDLAESQADAYSLVAKAYTERDDVTNSEHWANQITLLAREFCQLALFERRQIAEYQADAYSRIASAYVERKDVANAEHWATQIAQLLQEFHSLPLSERTVLAERQVWTYSRLTHAYAERQDAENAQRWAEQIAQLVQEFYPLPLTERRRLADPQADAYSRVALAYAERQDVANVQHWAEQITLLAKEFHPLPLSERRQIAESQANSYLQLANICARCNDLSKCQYWVDKIRLLAEEFHPLPSSERRLLADLQSNSYATMTYVHTAREDAVEAEHWVKQIMLLAEEFHGLSMSERCVLAERQAWSYLYLAALYAQRKDAANTEFWIEKIAQLVQEFHPLPLSERRQLAELLAESHARVVRAYAKHKDATNAKKWADRTTKLVQEFYPLPLSERCVLAKWQAKSYSEVAIAYAERKDLANCQLWADRVTKIVIDFQALPYELSERDRIKTVTLQYLANLMQESR